MLGQWDGSLGKGAFCANLAVFICKIYVVVFDGHMQKQLTVLMGNQNSCTTQLAQDLNKTSITVISNKVVWSSDVKGEL